MMVSDYRTTESSYLEDPTRPWFTQTSDGTSHYTDTQTMNYSSGSQNVAFNANMTSSSMTHNSTSIESLNSFFTQTSPTEETVTTEEQGNSGGRRRRRRRRDSDSNGTLDSTESRVVSQCLDGNCQCANLTVKNMEYQFESGNVELILLGYFPVHGTPPGGEFCSEFNRKRGYEPLMAFKYALKRVNKDPNLLGNLRLG